MDDWIDGYDTQGLLVFAAIIVVPVIVALVRMAMFPSAAFLDRWFEHQDLARTPEAEALVVSALVTMKRVRTIGFVAAYAVPQLGWLLVTRDAARSNELRFEFVFAALWCVTVFLAAVWATDAVNTSDRAGRGEGLTGRHLDRYRPAFTRHDHLVLVIGLGLVAGLALVFPGSDADRAIAPTSVAQLAGAALVVMALVRVGQKRIVSARVAQPSIDLIRADDAIRTTGVSALTGLGYGAPLFAIATLFWQLVYVHEPGGAFTLVATLVAFALFAAALSMIVGFGRLGNDAVVYRNRLRPAAEFEDASPAAVEAGR